MNTDSLVRAMTAAVLVMGAAALPQSASAQTPAAGGRPVRFTKDVAPIFQEACEAVRLHKRAQIDWRAQIDPAGDFQSFFPA